MRKYEPQRPELLYFSVESATYICLLSKRGDSVKNIDSLENQWKQTWRKKCYNFTWNCGEAQGLGATVKFRGRSIKILETEDWLLLKKKKISHRLPIQLEGFHCSASQQFIILTITILQILPCKRLETFGQSLKKVPQPLTFCVSLILAKCVVSLEHGQIAPWQTGSWEKICDLWYFYINMIYAHFNHFEKGDSGEQLTTK